jgi:hypothetical protein
MMADSSTSRSKRGYGSIEDGVKIVNYNEDQSSAINQSTRRAPPCSSRRSLHQGIYCIGLVVIIAAILGHHAGGGTTSMDASTLGQPKVYRGQLLGSF